MYQPPVECLVHDFYQILNNALVDAVEYLAGANLGQVSQTSPSDILISGLELVADDLADE